MTAPTPGAYIKMRRCAAGFSVADVAARLHAEPHMDERGRTEWLELIEADAQPCSLATIVALRKIFDFNVDVLVALERIAQGSAERPPDICGICGFSAPYRKELCSACAGLPPGAHLQVVA